MTKMTLKEKIGQMYQTGHEGTEVTGPQFDASKTVKNVKDKPCDETPKKGNETFIQYNIKPIPIKLNPFLFNLNHLFFLNYNIIRFFLKYYK